MFATHRSITLALLTLTAPVFSQTAPPTVDAPKALVEPLGLTGGTVQHLVLPFNDRKPFTQTIVVDGRPRVLELAPNSIRTADFKVFEETGQGGWRQLETPPETTYLGTVRGAPDSIAAVTVYQGQLAGTVMMREGTWTIEPATQVNPTLPRTAHVVYSAEQVRPVGDFCGVEDGMMAQPVTDNDHAEGGIDNHNAEIMLHLTFAFRNLYGGNNGALNQIDTIQNTVKAVYARDVGINNLYRGAFFARNFTNSSNALNQFQALWRTEPGLRRDLAQCYMQNPSASAPLGIAYLGTVCNTALHYSVVWNSSNLTVRIVTSAHEMGHSWNAGHCSGGGCWIMCSFVGGCGGLRTQFGTTSQNRIINFRNSRGCLN